MQSMQEVMKLVATNKAKLNEHPFFKWIKSEDVPLSERLMFAPILTVFVMNFRDMNKWFIRFENEVDQFKDIINGNTDEDETHSALFVEDWKKLNLDSYLGWKASDTIWWLFLAEDTEPFRAYGVDFARMTIEDDGDPMVRFAHSEAGEACGNVFFSTVSPIADQVTKENGINYRYFGSHHFDREQGHVIASEGIFEHQPLSEDQAKLGLKLAAGMFVIFEGMHNHFYNYGKKYVKNRIKPQRPEVISQPVLEHALPSPAREKVLMTAMHAEVQAALDARRLKTAKHPFYTWLRSENGISSLEKIQRFIPMWVVDIMGYRDLNRYALRIPEPRTDDEAEYNRWVDTLETHSAIFLRDWEALGMDEALGWQASETLDFLFLDPGTDVHRRNIASFIKLALKHDKPVLRFWLLEALEASGEAFFYNTRHLAREVELENGCRLDYLADRHDAGEETQLGRWSHLFKGEPMDAQEQQIALAMVETIFNAVDEQLSLSLEVAVSNKLGIPSPESVKQNMPPRLVSENPSFIPAGV